MASLTCPRLMPTVPTYTRAVIEPWCMITASPSLPIHRLSGGFADMYLHVKRTDYAELFRFMNMLLHLARHTHG